MIDWSAQDWRRVSIRIRFDKEEDEPLELRLEDLYQAFKERWSSISDHHPEFDKDSKCLHLHFCRPDWELSPGAAKCMKCGILYRDLPEVANDSTQ